MTLTTFVTENGCGLNTATLNLRSPAAAILIVFSSTLGMSSEARSLKVSKGSNCRGEKVEKKTVIQIRFAPCTIQTKLFSHISSNFFNTHLIYIR